MNYAAVLQTNALQSNLSHSQIKCTGFFNGDFTNLSWVSNLTNSWEISEEIDASFCNRRTQVTRFSTRLCRLGASEPVGHLRLSKRGWRYWVLRLRLPLLNWRRFVKASPIWNPRGSSSAAQTTSDVESFTSASPVNLAPGSIFNRGAIWGFGKTSFRIMVNG